MTKKSPILAVNEPVKKNNPQASCAPKKRQAVRRPLPENVGQEFQREENHPSLADALVVLLSAARFHWSLFCHLFYYFFIRPYAYRWKPCYGMKAYGVCLPYGFEVHGFDVSHHQGRIDWNELQKTQTAPFPCTFRIYESLPREVISAIQPLSIISMRPASTDLSAEPIIFTIPRQTLPARPISLSAP